MTNNKQGISLIVLVITIIVMIILAASIIISLNNSGVINRANEAVNASNEKQVQQLASTIWADVYLDARENKVKHIESEVITRLEKELGLSSEERIEDYYDVTFSESGVNVSNKKENWIPLVEEELVAIEGIISVPQSVFKYGYRYRITVASSSYSGSFETDEINIADAKTNGTIDDMAAIFEVIALDNGKRIKYENMQEFQSKTDELSEDAIILLIVINVETGEKYIFIESMVEDVTITKIEELEVKIAGTKILESPMQEGLAVYMLGISGDLIDPSKRYIAVTDRGIFEGSFNGYEIEFKMGDMSCISITNKNIVSLWILGGYLSLYECGSNNNVIVEGDNVIVYKDSQWVLAKGKNNIPKVVAGKEIKAVYATALEKLYYDGSFELIIVGDAIFGEVSFYIEVAPNVDPEAFCKKIMEEKESKSYMGGKLDFTAFEDLPFLETYAKEPSEIEFIVNQSVADKYPHLNLIVGE